ncbi:hypothetical protein LguiB_019193 [Lonicera macranthoides]
MENSKLHVVILVSPGMGHLIPDLLLANHLATHHIYVTLLVVTTPNSPAESLLIRPLLSSKLLHLVHMPPPDISALVDPTTAVVTLISIMMREAQPGIRAAISALSRQPDLLIVDLFGTEAWKIADEFKMAKYIYVPSTALFVALTTYCHVLDKEVDGQYVDQTEPLIIPGCKPVRPEDVVDPMLDRNNQQYHEYVRMGTEYSRFDGILLNTWEDLELTSLKALRDEKALLPVVKVPVYPIGPLTKPAEPADSKTELIEWLDEQPSESVIYVSFGSGGTLSAQQVTELAWGLELSRQRFIWVVHAPVEGAADGTYFTSGNGSDGTPEYLPSEFLTRTRNVGWVVTTWAPQVEILNHQSVGGFLTHCGWNSTLESIKGGVPMIAWPLYAEQRVNATMLAEELGVALRPAVLPTKKVVEREEVEKLVRGLMECKEGKEARERVKELIYSGEKALSKDGSSYKALCEVIENWVRCSNVNKASRGLATGDC